ncbi:hypothetical protein CY34DRAFT_598882 [Suillus luteus UH-Slu-Lm8-n1]|uniref:Uncharacterized protein n=1 Tax=Suillus luteus UH-Slu-Lm8-n1 TaxID=930992 RepID=A0A0D0BNG6_9AGAM|nr:hypothetical protein CY34DRAFT_598882 [Suillus luteus UH-Slu-Lm8-n1]
MPACKSEFSHMGLQAAAVPAALVPGCKAAEDPIREVASSVQIHLTQLRFLIHNSFLSTHKDRLNLSFPSFSLFLSFSLICAGCIIESS